jgi:hypothetical protein
MCEDIEARRRKVDRELRDGTDAKMLMGSRQEALKHLERAWRLAVEEPRLRAPWPQVTAYRLAHLLMREEEADLSQAERLFAEAAKLEELGPLPRIYQAAALHRLGRPQREVEKALNQGREVLALDSRGRTGQGRAYERAGIQSQGYNLLELASYFVGTPYRLEGMGGPWADLFPATEACVMVGPSRHLAEVRYPRALALRELEARAQDSPEALFFELYDGGEAGRWCLGSGEWQSVSGQPLRLLALLLREQRPTVEILGTRLGLTGNNNAFRQARLRLKEALEGIRPGPAFAETGRGAPLRLANDLAYGVLPDRFLLM